MTTFLSIVYVIVCVFLILVVLLQSGKGGGLGSAFGGGGAGQQIFGGAGAGNLLTRLTAFFAFLFMVLSAVLAYLSSSGEQALDRAVRQQGAAETTEEVSAETGLGAGAADGADLESAESSGSDVSDTGAAAEPAEPANTIDDKAVSPVEKAESDAEGLVEDLQEPEGPAVPGPYR